MVGALAMGAAILGASASGDFDADGRRDSAEIVRKADGTQEAFVTFANGERAFVTRVEGRAKMAPVPPERIETLCGPIKRDMPDCTARLHGRYRQGLWIELLDAPGRHLALWNGVQFRVVTSLWPKL